MSLRVFGFASNRCSWPRRSHRSYSSEAAKSSTNTTNSNTLYTKQHLWLRIDEKVTPNVLTLGVSNLYKERLGMVASVQLAGNPGIHMPRGVLIGIITHADTSDVRSDDEFTSNLSQTEIFSPVEGEILEINEDIERDAEAFVSPLPEHSWLYKLKYEGKKSDDESIMNAEEYQKYLASLGWLV